MSLWYAQSGPRSRDTGKFRSRAKLGSQSASDGKHRGWHFHFVCHQTGTSVRRTSYSVTISDTQRNRVEYLRDFSSVEQAETAACEWIDRKLNYLPTPLSAGEVGTIPAAPDVPTAQEK